MLLHISSDGPPIYDQIADQIRFRIVAGQLKAGDELPTIRGLAQSLRVNPNTVARAYRELEHEGLVEKRRTTGTFVSELTQRHGIAERRRMLAPQVDKLLIQSRQLGLSLDDVIGQIQQRNEQISPEVKSS